MLHFTFHEEIMGKRQVPHVIVRLGDMQWGDPLNDNAEVEDFYRYHDLFHLGLHALTGWSPVTEYFLNNRDEVIVKKEKDYYGCELEEGASAVLFEIASQHGFYQQEKPADLETDLFIRYFRHTPLAMMKADEWGDTLQTIYGVFTRMVEHRGGRLEVDAAAKHFQYKPL